MKSTLKLDSALVLETFYDMPYGPLSIYFTPGAKMLTEYSFLKPKVLYNVTDYWQNPKLEMMIKLLEFNHYIKFTAGNVILSNYIIQN